MQKNKKPSLCRVVFLAFVATLTVVCGSVAIANSMESAPTERVVVAIPDPMS